jgi:OOP family OmpA-OmpF porin
MNRIHLSLASHEQTLKLSRLALAIGIATVVISPLVWAEETTKYDLTSNWYGGLNIGQTRESINDGFIANTELGGGLTSITDDRRDNGYKLFAGYQLNDNFALEAGYFDLGQFGFRAIKEPLGALKSRTKTRGFNIDLVGTVPITENFSAFGRAGAHYSEAKDRFQGSGDVVVTDSHRRERDVNFKWGGGLQYDFTQKLGMRIEAERYAINDITDNNGSINFYSLGVLYRFGEKNAAPVKYEEPVTRREQMRDEYCTTLDVQFEINNAEIQREDLERLAVVGTFLKKYPDTNAVIEGHTDNIGTPESNLVLSRHRAESVMTYLVREQRVASARISAVGYGDTRPIADNATEDGKRANRRINAMISCANDVEGLTPPAAARVTMGMLIEFDNNSAAVKSQYHKELTKVAKFLKENKTVTATIEGHTADLQTSPALAQDISLKRAQNVVDYLVKNEGIERSRLTAEGFGKTRRYSYNTSAAGQQDNRRVNIIFNYPK